MNDVKATSCSTLALLSLMLCLPPSASAAMSSQDISAVVAPSSTQLVAQLITPAADGSQTLVDTQPDHTLIEGGVQVNENLFHRFDDFSVKAGNTADFITPDSVQSVIGQVSGGRSSYIDGTLQVSGSDADLYLLNPAGVFFGAEAQLNLGGSFTATTADQLVFGDDWLTVLTTREYNNFEGAPTASQFTAASPSAVVNQAELAVPDQQAIRLIGGDVINTGTLRAPSGEVTLSAVPGESLVRFDANGALLSVEVEADLLPQSITQENLQGNEAERFSEVSLSELITGAGTDEATDLNVNADGSVSLTSIVEAVDQSVVSDGSATTVSAGAIDVSSQADGPAAAQRNGGYINLLGSNVRVLEGSLNASGADKGGLIRIGGDYQGQGTLPNADTAFVGDSSVVRADALDSGNGGQVIVWSDGDTQVLGSLSANGAGQGAGGLVETSGLDQLTIGDQANISTDSPSGAVGIWLLDPTDLTIVSRGGGARVTDGVNDSNAPKLKVETLVSALDQNNVTLQASNSITVEAAVNASGNARSNSLRLEASTINLDEAINLKLGSLLSGTATTVNVGANGNLQNAMDAVATGGTVNLAASTYAAPEIQVYRNVTLQGQGTDRTLIQGNNSVRAFSISAGTTTLDSLTIENGNDTTGNQNGGGAIRVSNTAGVNLLNSLVRNNRTNSSGGGLYLEGEGTSLIQNSTLEANAADGFGGGISVSNGHQLTIDNSFVVGNLATNGAGLDGLDNSGAITIRDSIFGGNTAAVQGGAFSVGPNNGALTIENSVFENNMAPNGGGLFSNGAAIAITGSTFRGNQALDNATGEGGAIFTIGTLTVDNSRFESNSAQSGGALFLAYMGDSRIETTTFDNNTATDGGAIFLKDQHQLTIERSTLSNNTSDQDGGAIVNESILDTGLTVAHSTLSGNESQNRTGGALLIGPNSGANLTNVTVTNNSAGVVGGGIYHSGRANALVLQNTIIAGNSAPVGPDLRTLESFLSNGNNLVQDRAGATGYISSDLIEGTDPRLGLLADNGGPTLTHALLADSPAINAGSVFGTLTQRGVGVSGQRDIGAYERLTATNVSFVAGGGQSAIVDTAFTNNLQIQVRDLTGAALEGVSIQIDVPTAGATGNIGDSASLLGVTDVNGLFSLPITAGTVAGDFSVSVLADSRSDLVTLTNLPDVVDSLNIISGNNQSAAVATAFSEDLLVEVRDRFNNPIAGESVNFVAPATGASGLLSNTPTVTNTLGQTAIEVTANDSVGTYLVTTSLAGLTEQFSLSNTGDSPTITATTDPSPIEPSPTDPSPTDPSPLDPTSTDPTSTEPLDPNAPGSSPELPNEDNPGVTIDPLSNESFVPTQPSPTEPSSTATTLSVVQSIEDENQSEKPGRLAFFDGAAFSAVEQSLSEEYAKYWGRPLENEDATLDEIQQTLRAAEEQYKSKTALVYALFVPGSGQDSLSDNAHPSVLSQRLLRNDTHNEQDQLMLMMIPPQGEPIQQLVEVSRKDLTLQAKLLGIEISSFLDDGYQPLARQLYSWLLEPLEEDLQHIGVDNLMYVLDEGLRTTPLAAMMDGDSYAIERYGLSMLPSVGLLQTDFGTRPAAQNVLTAGADQFTDQENLPAVPVELDLVRTASNSSQTLFNEDFSIENVTAAQESAPQGLMHLATHAVFNTGSVDQSYIQFWDEKLTLDKLPSLGLDDLELLILSACTTALGNREAELGFAGLAAAAGVESSIGSLWNVSDLGTMALMAEFYEQLRVDPLRFSALQQAQLSLIHGDTRIDNDRLITQQSRSPIPEGIATQAQVDFSHPFFWSGFSLIGNPWW